MNHRDVHDSAIFFWAKTAYGFALPIIAAVGLYYGLQSKIEETNDSILAIHNDLIVHETQQFAKTEAAEEKHYMYEQRLLALETGDKLMFTEITEFLSRVSEQLKIPFNL